jgi:hypothetical protein
MGNWHKIIGCILVAAAIGSWAANGWADGGPENVFLVVNANSAASLTIANHYIEWRRIPPNNVFYIAWKPNLQTTDIDTFRQRILLPVLRAIEQRHLADQIDCVVYSSDFPTAITLDSDVRKFTELLRSAANSSKNKSPEDNTPEKKPGDGSQPSTQSVWPIYLTPVGALTGMTYLWQTVASGRPNYFDMKSNHYMQPPSLLEADAPSRGFRGNRLYDPRGEVVAKNGHRYFLSMMLGVTTGRGNTVGEVLSYLHRSVDADETHPKGTIYFVRNSDIRSKVREEYFSPVMQELKKLGVAAEILEGTVPLRRNDVQGAVIGTANFDWQASGSTILPGTICEHLTSFGGAMVMDASQTPLSEFLRYGAAGASGTVAEPVLITVPKSIPYKFPLPTIQLHYARGCTLAEAFYQSVYAPYQLLIVGDPLCRPWAEVPRVSVAGVKANDVVHGILTLTPTAMPASDLISRFALCVDGRRIGECLPGGRLSLDTRNFADGYHELRVVAFGPEPIESSGRTILSTQFDNHGRKIEVSLQNKGPLKLDASAVLVVKSAGSTGFVVLQNSRVVGQISGAEGQIEIPAKMFGTGPVELRVIALGDGGDVRMNAVAEPITLIVE